MSPAFKKRGARLGQHFLKAPWAAAALADSANIQKDDTVVEIGPGTGALTKELLARGARVIAIEKDERLVEELSRTFAAEIERKRLRIISDDIRNVSPESLGLTTGSYIVAANIPYYITGEIVRQFLSSPLQPRTMALLVQKEVAERIVSKPAKGGSASGGKESILSLSVKIYGTPKLERVVSRGNFSPPPSVDSAILSISNISRKNFSATSEELFFRCVKAGFSSKRKVLRNNLTSIAPPERIKKVFDACGLSENTRAEDVPLSVWLALTRALSS